MRDRTRRKNTWVRDGRDVHPRREEIDRHGELRQGLIAKAPDALGRALDAAGDLRHGGVVLGSVARVEALLEYAHDEVGVRVIDAEHQRLAGLCGVDLASDHLAHDAVVALGDDLAVKVIELDVHLVGQGRVVFGRGRTVVDGHALADAEVNPARRELRVDGVGHVVVDEPPVEHGVLVAVLEHGAAEDVRGVQGRSGREPDAHGVEVVEHAAIFREVVALVAKAELGLGHLAVEGVAAVTLIDDDAVIAVDRRNLVDRLGEEDPPDHPLHRGDVKARSGFGVEVAQPLHLEDLVKRAQPFELGLTKRLQRLLAEHGAVDEKEHAPKAPRLDEPVDQPEARAGLARPRGHRDEEVAAPFAEALLDGGDGAELIVPQPEIVGGFGGEARVGGFDIDREEVAHALGRVPPGEHAGVVLRATHVMEVNPAALGQLHHERAPVGREEERHTVTFPRPARGRGDRVVGAKGPRVAPRLFERARNVRVEAFGFDDGDGGGSVEENVVGDAVFGGPLGDGASLSALGTRAARVGERRGIDLPADGAQGRVDERARLGLAEVELGSGNLRRGEGDGGLGSALGSLRFELKEGLLEPLFVLDREALPGGALLADGVELLEGVFELAAQRALARASSVCVGLRARGFVAGLGELLLDGVEARGERAHLGARVGRLGVRRRDEARSARPAVKPQREVPRIA